MFLFAKKKSFVFLLSPYLVNHGKAAANVKKYIFIFILCLIHKDWQWPTESYVIQIQISLKSEINLEMTKGVFFDFSKVSTFQSCH